MPSLDRVPPSSHSHAVISSDIYLYPDIYDLHHYDHRQSPSSSHSRKFSGSVISIFTPGLLSMQSVSWQLSTLCSSESWRGRGRGEESRRETRECLPADGFQELRHRRGELEMNLREVWSFTIMEIWRMPLLGIGAFSWLKVPARAFTFKALFKTLC